MIVSISAIKKPRKEVATTAVGDQTKELQKLYARISTLANVALKTTQ